MDATSVAHQMPSEVRFAAADGDSKLEMVVNAVRMGGHRVLRGTTKHDQT